MCLAPAAAMEMEELQEADVLWPDHDDDCQANHCRHQQLEAVGKQPQGAGGDAPRGGDARRRRAGSSAPLGIVRAGSTGSGGPPPWARSCYDSEESASAFVPPHVVLAARRRCQEGRAASSVCEGQGRTLKGRDLQSVRTAVLRMTGFLET
ncbi:uncharacterized protein LOC120664905 [Panicum virgatum]|uniref:Uncharacterized protein n=1 Tax=Panicum virgatum TaxID=38727 RepID=A0A8T0U0R8_PANVG|nr:uncharacterized protein LOC120664905 [Panicum virgatum]KAG2618092.1 hypothetical protein PVAP13_3NG258175 [Panicum virgatum]